MAKNKSISKKNSPIIKNLKAIRFETFKPSLQTISNVDYGLDLSSYAFAGLRTWNK
jgi:hypothetical protein